MGIGGGTGGDVPARPLASTGIGSGTSERGLVVSGDCSPRMFGPSAFVGSGPAKAGGGGIATLGFDVRTAFGGGDRIPGSRRPLGAAQFLRTFGLDFRLFFSAVGGSGPLGSVALLRSRLGFVAGIRISIAVPIAIFRAITVRIVVIRFSHVGSGIRHPLARDSSHPQGGVDDSLDRSTELVLVLVLVALCTAHTGGHRGQFGDFTGEGGVLGAAVGHGVEWAAEVFCVRFAGVERGEEDGRRMAGGWWEDGDGDGDGDGRKKERKVSVWTDKEERLWVRDGPNNAFRAFQYSRLQLNPSHEERNK